MSLTERIEKNRLALLAILAPWIAFVFFHCGRGEKPLPPRVAAFALAIITKMERAAGCLLFAVAYLGLPQPSRERASALRAKAMCIAGLGAHATRGALTVTALYRRLAAVWRVLTKLRKIARQLIGDSLLIAKAHEFEAIALCWSAISKLSPLSATKPP
ncbi:MAG: hypothetical protein AAGG69_03915 [Pseudomonadota bacterium]